MDGNNIKHREIFNRYFVQALIEFFVLAAIISLIGLAAYNRMDILLIDSLRESVAQQGQSTAYVLGERFQHKLDELQARTELLQKGEISPEDAIAIATIGTRDGRLRGILRKNNTPLVGKPLPPKAFDAIHRTWLGHQSIEYLHGTGLIFAVPFVYEEESYIFYEVFDDEAVQDFYKMMSYNGKGTLILASNYDEWLLLAGGQYPALARGQMPNFTNIWQDIEHSQLAPGQTNSVYAEDEEYAFFLHSTYISPQDNLTLAGYVEWDDVVVGIDYIYTLMYAMHGIVLSLLFLVVGHHMRTRQLKHFEHQTALSESANKAKSEFLSRMSHEIRTPINAVMGMGEMILRESKEPAILEYAKNLQHAAKNLLELINDILDFSKIEAGKMEIIPVDYQISSMLNDIVTMIETRATAKQLAFHVEADSSIPDSLFGDEVRIKQVVMNLLTNAVKYTEKGSVTLKVSSQPLADRKISLQFSVTDTGIGIKQEDMGKLFSSFERIEEKRNRTIEGTGLGMNIARQLLSMMGSQLKVESVYGEGSTFSFSVEQTVMNPEPMGDFEEAYRRSLTQHSEYHVAFQAPEAQILVVDDTVMNLTVVKGLLKQTKIQIDTATSGSECLDAVQKKKYDIIFLDHMMPGMDGIETLYAMRTLSGNQNQDTPVISLTANAIRGAKDQYMAAGFRDYLTKPINCAKLEGMIEKYLPKEKIMEISYEGTEQDSEACKVFYLPSWVRETTGLDVPAGVEHCGSAEAYFDVLTVFAESIEATAKEIEGYFQQEEWNNYTTKVHALKSTAKIIGAAELSERARRLEDAGKKGYIEEIRQDHRPMMDLYLSYAEKLAPLIPQEEADSDKPPIDEAELAEAFEAIGEMAATFDYDSLMFIFESLDGYRLPEDKAALYKEIKAAAAKPDWEKVRELLDSSQQA